MTQWIKATHGNNSAFINLDKITAVSYDTYHDEYTLHITGQESSCYDSVEPVTQASQVPEQLRRILGFQTGAKELERTCDYCGIPVSPSAAFKADNNCYVCADCFKLQHPEQYDMERILDDELGATQPNN